VVAGYVGTKAMEPVSMFFYRHEPAQARAIEDAARPGRVTGIEQPAIDWPALRDYRGSMVRRRPGPRRSRDRRLTGSEPVRPPISVTSSPAWAPRSPSSNARRTAPPV
jgi:hypothetical protein